VLRGPLAAVTVVRCHYARDLGSGWLRPASHRTAAVAALPPAPRSRSRREHVRAAGHGARPPVAGTACFPRQEAGGAGSSTTGTTRRRGTGSLPAPRHGPRDGPRVSVR